TTSPTPASPGGPNTTDAWPGEEIREYAPSAGARSSDRPAPGGRGRSGPPGPAARRGAPARAAARAGRGHRGAGPPGVRRVPRLPAAGHLPPLHLADGGQTGLRLPAQRPRPAPRIPALRERGPLLRAAGPGSVPPACPGRRHRGALARALRAPRPTDAGR